MLPLRHRVTRALRLRIATPAGGAPFWWCRGCTILVALAVPASLPALTVGEIVTVPAGQMVTLDEVLEDTGPGALWLRLRFVAPDIARGGGSVAAADAHEDMAHLCAEIAAPYAFERALTPERVVISLSDRTIAFGASDPDVTQFFELFSLDGTRCIWEEF